MHHMFSAFGCLISPLIVGFLLSRQMKWQYGYEGVGIALLALALIVLCGVRIPWGKSKNEFEIAAISRLVRRKNFALLVFVAFLAMGTQFSLIYLSVTFLKEAKGFSVVVASAVLSAFFVGMIFGRLICGWLASHTANARITTILLASLILSCYIAWRGAGWISALGVAMAGLAVSGISPSLLAVTGEFYREMAGTAMGVLLMMSGFGGMFFCWLTAQVSQKTDPGFGFVVPLASALLAFALFLIPYRDFLRGEQERRSRFGRRAM